MGSAPAFRAEAKRPNATITKTERNRLLRLIQKIYAHDSAEGNTIFTAHMRVRCFQPLAQALSISILALQHTITSMNLQSKRR
jgi:predicted DNA-binding ribbon-helix-helix protein